MIMITGRAKEIADLVLAIQGQRNKLIQSDTKAVSQAASKLPIEIISESVRKAIGDIAEAKQET